MLAGLSVDLRLANEDALPIASAQRGSLQAIGEASEQRGGRPGPTALLARLGDDGPVHGAPDVALAEVSEFLAESWHHLLVPHRSCILT